MRNRPFSRRWFAAPRGTFAAAALWGMATCAFQTALAGLVLSWPPLSKGSSSPSTSMFVLVAGAAAVFLVPVLLGAIIGTLITDRRSRPRPVASSIASFILGFRAGGILEAGFLPVSNKPLLSSINPSTSGVTLLIALLIGVAWFVAYGHRRGTHSRLRLARWCTCRRCGSAICNAGSQPCPGCGGTQHWEPRRGKWAVPSPRWLRAWAAIAALLLVGSVAAHAARWSRVIEPARAKLLALNPSVCFDVRGPGMFGDDGLRAIGAFIPLPDSASTGVAVLVPAGQEAERPVRVLLATLTADAAGLQAVGRAMPGAWCDLTAEQADRLFAQGVPGAMIAGLSAAARVPQRAGERIGVADLETEPPGSTKLVW